MQRFDFAGCKAQGQDTAAGRSILHYGMIATGNHDHFRFAARSTTPLLSLTYVPAGLVGAVINRPRREALRFRPAPGAMARRCRRAIDDRPYRHQLTFRPADSVLRSGGARRGVVLRAANQKNVMIAPRAFPRCAQSPVAIIPLSIINRPRREALRFRPAFSKSSGMNME